MSEQVDGIRMRLDKYLCELNLGTRSQVKKDIKAGLVSVNGVTVLCPEKHVQAKEDSISYKGQPCCINRREWCLPQRTGMTARFLT